MHKKVNALPTHMELLDADSSRTGATIYNNSNKNLYILLGADATNEQFTVLLLTGSYWEVPESYKGDVTAVCSNGVSGTIQVTYW